jgi:SulP family sulfate permease
MNIVKEYQQDLQKEFAGYNKSRFSKDLLSGITVAAVALPLALAFGVSSGATAAAGLVTAVIAGVVIGGLSGASFQISGPTGAMTAILITITAKYGMQGILLASFLAGCILIVAGALKLGKIIYFIPSSVITGFTSGIAIIIALGQLDNLFGVKSEGELAIIKVLSYFTSGFDMNWQAALIGFMVILIMIVWPKKWNAKVPSSLVALAIVLIFNYFAKFDVAVVGEIPKSIFLQDRMTLSTLLDSEIWDFVIPSFSIAALAMIESLLCGASAGKMKNEKLNADRELIAQGVGNVLIPFFGGVPATAAIARTSVAIKSGCETRLAGIIHALVLLLSMFVLAPVMSSIPLSALAGVLIITAWRMNDWENIHYIFGHRFKTGMAKFGITMVATVVLDLTQAIIIGVAFSTFLVVVKLTDIEINVSEIDNRRLEEVGMKLPVVPEHIRVVYLTGTIFFAVVDKLVKELSKAQDHSVVILSMRGVPVIDLSGVQSLTDVAKEMKERDIKIILTSVQPKVLRDLTRGGFIDVIGEENVYRSAELAIVQAAQDHMDTL